MKLLKGVGINVIVLRRAGNDSGGGEGQGVLASSPSMLGMIIAVAVTG